VSRKQTSSTAGRTLQSVPLHNDLLAGFGAAVQRRQSDGQPQDEIRTYPPSALGRISSRSCASLWASAMVGECRVPSRILIGSSSENADCLPDRDHWARSAAARPVAACIRSPEQIWSVTLRCRKPARNDRDRLRAGCSGMAKSVRFDFDVILAPTMPFQNARTDGRNPLHFKTRPPIRSRSWA